MHSANQKKLRQDKNVALNITESHNNTLQLHGNNLTQMLNLNYIKINYCNSSSHI